MLTPLSGLRIVELAQGIVGPYCAMQLADCGAQVVKVEPLAGDRSRRFGPVVGGEGALFAGLNRNKQSLALDINATEGQDLVKQLVQHADVFIEDLGVGGAQALSLDYESLRQRNGRLIYAAISPFGEEGPLNDLPGSELVVQAVSDTTGTLGRLDKPPVRLGADVTQVTTSFFLFQAVMAALFMRLRTNKGQRVSVSMLGSMHFQRGLMWTARSEPDDWFGHLLDAYVRPPDHGYMTSDRPIKFSLGRGTDEDWYQLLMTLDMLEVMGDERFDNGGREAVGIGRYSHEVHEIWEEAFKDKTADEVIEIIRRFHGHVVPMNDYNSLCSHPQVEAMNLIRDIPLHDGSTIAGMFPPWEFSESQLRAQNSPPPALGEHTDEILTSLGYSSEKVEQLALDGIVRRQR